MFQVAFPHRRNLFAIVCFAAFLDGVSLVLAADFRITSIRTTNNDIRLNWNAPGGSNYVVQSANRLAITNSNTNFVDLSPVIPVPSPGLQATSYTHLGGRTGASNRFYRIRAFPIPQSLRIEPTNAVIGIGMTNRYKVFAVYSSSNQDVTGEAMITSLSSVAQVSAPANGFARVRGQSVGMAMIQAVFQGRTNAVSLTVGRLTGLSTEPPLFTINDYVAGSQTSVKVMGVFSDGSMVNITPSSNLEGSFGGAPAGTQLSYSLAANVANSFALISGQSAAAGDLVFTGLDEFGDYLSTSSFHVNWCWLTSIALLPQNAHISVGGAQQFSVVGTMANGVTTNALQVGDVNVTAFTSTDFDIAQTDSGLRVTGQSAGSATVEVTLYNGPGDFCVDGLSALANVSVGFPPAITIQPATQTVSFGNDANFSPAVSGTPPLTFQWQFNGTNIAGATSASLTISNVAYVQGGDYRVMVTNAFGSVTSAIARLTVTNQPGAALWTNRYHGPIGGDGATAVAVDGAGNVYVTGSSRGSINIFDTDYATVKYSGAGVPLWTNRYNGPGNDSDGATAVAVDGNGNVLVTGTSTGSGSGRDYATIKYSSEGATLWINRYNGPANGFDDGKAIAVDADGNVFVTGDSSDDYVTIKYSSAGVPLWTNRYNGPGNSVDSAQSIALDRGGGAYVTGFSTGTNGDYDFATVVYSSAGVPFWTNRYSGIGNNADVANAVVVDQSRNVYVTGYSFGTNGFNEYLTIKYSRAGGLLWMARYNGAPSGSAVAQAVALDSSENVLVTGHTGFSFDYATLKYSSAGVPSWTNLYNGPVSSTDQPSSLAVDPIGNVFVTGRSWNGAADDYATVAYSAGGLPIWTNRYNGPGNNLDQASAIAVDNRGSVFVTGTSYGGSNGNSADYATIKYGSACLASNDTFLGRTSLSGALITATANNACTTKEPGEPDHATNNVGGKSVWWTWTAPASALVTIATCGSDFDTILAVYTGMSVSALSLIANNDDSIGCGEESLQSQVQFVANAGTSYQIAVDGNKYFNRPAAESGNIVLTIQQ